MSTQIIHRSDPDSALFGVSLPNPACLPSAVIKNIILFNLPKECVTASTLNPKALPALFGHVCHHNRGRLFPLHQSLGIIASASQALAVFLICFYGPSVTRRYRTVSLSKSRISHCCQTRAWCWGSHQTHASFFIVAQELWGGLLL